MDADAAPRPRKRSLIIDGRRTSVSIEPPAWLVIKRIARERSVAIKVLLAEIDRSRGTTSLSGAVRAFALAHADAHGQG